MPEYCTIYSPRLDYSGIVNVLEQVSERPIIIDGVREKWQSLVVNGDKSNITFNAMSSLPGQFTDFSRLALGTYNHFNKINTVAEANKERVLKLISECQMAIGIMVP
ncbi:MAG: hypothetical protein JO250_14600 [Armatimonadetes bacterium]|nr:hypothetical protein [Armatimonadota bacterium]